MNNLESDTTLAKIPPTHKKTFPKIPKWLGPLLSVGVLFVAFWFLHRELSSLSRDVITAEIQALSWHNLLAAFFCMAGSYFSLILYDILALRYINKKITYKNTALTAFIAYAVGHNVGFSALSGGTVRYRMYSLFGLSSSDIALITLFISITFALGISFLLGSALWILPPTQTAILKLPALAINVISIVLILIPIGYLIITFFSRSSLTLINWKIRLPHSRIAMNQLGIAVAELLFASGTLYVLLEPHLPISYFSFLGIYLLALAAGILSSVPGGIGVFEAVLIATLPEVDRGVLLATMIVYRIIYYIIPLGVALLLFLGHEIRLQQDLFLRAKNVGREWISSLAPQLVSTAVFLAGVVLLISGSIPIVESRLAIIARAIPLPILELSHLMGSVLGVSLLVLARGLYSRLHRAYLSAVILLVAGIIISLLKGLDFEEAIILFIILSILLVSKHEFYRNKTFRFHHITPAWVAAVTVVIGAVFWVGLISFRYVEYSDQLWWKFAFNAEAPRMLRASLVAVITAFSFSLFSLFKSTASSNPAIGEDTDYRKIREILLNAKDASANIALLGDKRFIFSSNKNAFIMYQVYGRSWIAMGDPVGAVDEHEELAWAFRELVDQNNGRPIFYQVSEQSLSLYVDMGLSLSKLGEEGRVVLKDFSLEGSKHAEFRQIVNKAKKNGVTFEIISREHVSQIIAELRDISNEWLSDKGAAEKGFSIGRFSEVYICNFDCAVVRSNSKIVAFANLWPAKAVQELSIDLMRYSNNAPKGIMDYLFTELMLWGKDNDYEYFSLGMAPLSGLEQRALAPLWHKIGNIVFEHGENFYNFEGLRHYKEKFDPEWRPRYLACPGGVINTPSALLDTSRLISGGWKGLLIK